MQKKTARLYTVTGRVQGVGYRAFAQHAARQIGLTGWVRNLANGDVEAHANGNPAELEDFESRLRAGPRWAEVRGVNSEEGAVSTASTFEIR